MRELTVIDVDKARQLNTEACKALVGNKGNEKIYWSMLAIIGTLQYLDVFKEVQE